MAKEVCVLLSRYGDCPYVEELLDSLNRQTVGPELIIRRDDEDAGMHRGIKGSFRQLLSQVPASASYVMFCDQDDVWMPGKIEKILKAMKDAENGFHGPVLAHADAHVADKDLRILKRRFIAKWARKRDFFGTLMFNKVQGASMMINRPLLELIKDLPDEGPLYDRYIHLVAEIFGRRVFLDESLMYYRQHGSNQIGAFGRKPRIAPEFLNEDDRALQRGNEFVFGRFFSGLSPERKAVVKDYREFVTTRSPSRRLALMLRYLIPYPGTLAKKIVKVFFP